MGEEIRLFRELLRAARMMPQYNIRRYCQRRIVGDFRRAAQQGAVSAEERRERLRSGREALELIRRQNIIYGMYTTDFKNLLDKQ